MQKMKVSQPEEQKGLDEIAEYLQIINKNRNHEGGYYTNENGQLVDSNGCPVPED